MKTKYYMYFLVSFPKMFLYSVVNPWNQKQTNKKISGKNSCFCIIVRIWLWTWIEEDLLKNSMKVGLVKIPAG